MTSNTPFRIADSSIASTFCFTPSLYLQQLLTELASLKEQHASLLPSVINTPYHSIPTKEALSEFRQQRFEIKRLEDNVVRQHSLIAEQVRAEEQQNRRARISSDLALLVDRHARLKIAINSRVIRCSGDADQLWEDRLESEHLEPLIAAQRALLEECTERSNSSSDE
ncbi:hypothetical protein BDZ45DRAFT_744757 [Acephala macrosclerotiorum]|nr:hypothetical protein BDZ45DRAFT_744757 [Acephala macrosclerotiorum]